MALSEQAIAEIKKEMGYIDPIECCGKCGSFVPTDCSGSHNAKMQHCTFLPTFDIPVDERGRCKNWHMK